MKTRQAMYVKRNNEACFCNHFYSGKVTIITWIDCVSVVLFIQHEMRMRYIVICFPSVSTTCFHIISQTARCSKKKLLNIKFLFWFSLQMLSVTQLILYKLSEIRSKLYIGLHMQYPLFLSDINFSWILSTKFQIRNFMKIGPVWAELFHAYRRTDRHDEADSCFSQVCEGT